MDKNDYASKYKDKSTKTKASQVPLFALRSFAGPQRTRWTQGTQSTFKKQM